MVSGRHALTESPEPPVDGRTEAETDDDLTAMYVDCRTIIYNYTLSRTGDPTTAEDLVGDVFERALSSWPSFQRRSSVRVWLLGIARHVVADYWRRAARERPSAYSLLHVFEVHQGGPEEVAEREWLRSRLIAALATLSDDDRELLRLRYGADLPFREIATLLEKNEISLRVRQHRLLKRLRLALEQ